MRLVQAVPLAELDDWFPFLVYGLFAAAIPASMLVFSFVFSTRRTRRAPRAQLLPFESGVSTGPPAQQRFTVSFYLTAMLFIVFDIEIVFLYPVAIILDAAGAQASSSESSASKSCRTGSGSPPSRRRWRGRRGIRSGLTPSGSRAARWR
jgi:NADH-quinone oxidoreductase subunit A